MANNSTMYTAEGVEAPFFCDEPFSKPKPEGFDYCNLFCCCICLCCSKDKVRGLPRDAQAVEESERRQLLENLEGQWKIVLVEQPGRDALGLDPDWWLLSDISVQDDVVTMSSAPSNPDPRKVTWRLTFRRGRDQTGEEVYCDNLGSMITRFDLPGGEVEFDSALGFKELWQRQWKWEGKRSADAADAQAVPVVMGRLVEGAAPNPNPNPNPTETAPVAVAVAVAVPVQAQMQPAQQQPPVVVAQAVTAVG